MTFLVIDWAAALNLIGFSFSMVFLLLLFIVLVLNILGKTVTYVENAAQRRIQKEAEMLMCSAVGKEDNTVSSAEISGETLAAISLAMYAYLDDAHDEESNVITMEKVSKRYTPWSSKIYGLNIFSK
jgi:glutaconyl-CoA/methylmalonyl-CoA decarboxylase subunit delta